MHTLWNQLLLELSLDLSTLCRYVTDVWKMCIKKFDAEIFLSHLQVFNLVRGVSSKSYLLPSFISRVLYVDCKDKETVKHSYWTKQDINQLPLVYYPAVLKDKQYCLKAVKTYFDFRTQKTEDICCVMRNSWKFLVSISVKCLEKRGFSLHVLYPENITSMIPDDPQ